MTASTANIGLFRKYVWNLGRDSIDGWMRHDVARTGAALAFYTVFSLAPVLILSIAIAGFFFGEKAARGEIVEQIRGLIGTTGAGAVQSVLENAGRPAAGMLATIVSVATLLIGANTALAELKTGLDQIWEVPSEKRQGFWYFIRGVAPWDQPRATPLRNTTTQILVLDEIDPDHVGAFANNLDIARFRKSEGINSCLLNPLNVCAAAPRRQPSSHCSIQPDRSMETHMYIGGGILGTILVLLLIVYFVRRV